MTSKEAWNVFKTTGKVEDYLIYKKIKREEKNLN